MDAELKKKWIEALRSGKYEQAKGVLRNGDAYCCLGVLCSLDPEFRDWAQYSQSVSAPPVARTGLCGGGFPSPALQLAEMNDKGATFDEIANHIEAHL